MKIPTSPILIGPYSQSAYQIAARRYSTAVHPPAIRDSVGICCSKECPQQHTSTLYDVPCISSSSRCSTQSKAVLCFRRRKLDNKMPPPTQNDEKGFGARLSRNEGHKGGERAYIRGKLRSDIDWRLSGPLGYTAIGSSQMRKSRKRGFQKISASQFSCKMDGKGKR